MHPPLKALFKAVLEQRFAPPGAVKATLIDLSAAEAARIGSFLSGEIAVGVNSQAAVAVWISTQPALVELYYTLAWFRRFMYTISLRLL